MAHLSVVTNSGDHASPPSWVIDPKRSPLSAGQHRSDEPKKKHGETMSPSRSLSAALSRSPEAGDDSVGRGWVLKPSRSYEERGSPSSDENAHVPHPHYFVPEGSVPRSIVNGNREFDEPVRPPSVLGRAGYDGVAVAGEVKQGDDGKNEGKEECGRKLAKPSSPEATFVDYFGKSSTAGSSLSKLLAADGEELARKASTVALEPPPALLSGGRALRPMLSKDSSMVSIKEAERSSPEEAVESLSPQGLRSQGTFHQGSPPDFPGALLFSNEDSALRGRHPSERRVTEGAPSRSNNPSPSGVRGKVRQGI